VFLDIILPDDQGIKSRSNTIPPSIKPPTEILEQDVSDTLVELFLKMSNIEEELFVIRKELLKLNITPYDLFKTIATGESLFITELNLKNFLVKMKVSKDLAELARIGIYAFNRNKYFRMSFIDFLEALLPFEPDKFENTWMGSITVTDISRAMVEASKTPSKNNSP